MKVPVRRALVSVSWKSGLVDFCRRLVEYGVEIVSSGGTARALEEAWIPVTTVSSVTGSPEMLGGRVKTLHPRIHAAILADPTDPEHRQDLADQKIEPFQLVVSNLYPFETTVADGASIEEIVEQIDIGGPALTRAAAKNHAHVGIVTHPSQYGMVADAVAAGGLDDELRLRLAKDAFFATASYDAAIVEWLHRDDPMPEHVVLALRRRSELRYGENPHQEAATYRLPGTPAWWDSAHQVQGKEMSYNNFLDADAAWRLVNRFDQPAAVIVKHTNPCGVAAGDTIADAFSKAWACDPTSAFGSVIALNRVVDEPCAHAMLEAGFIEVVVAPGAADDALFSDRKNLRLLLAAPPARTGLDMRMLDRGFLVQSADTAGIGVGWITKSERHPTPEELRQLRFAWNVVAATKSNAIVVATNRMAVGIGAGDQSRLGAVERAVTRAMGRSAGAVAASDAFFPFRDALDRLAEAGVTAVAEPGGSMRDDEVVAAADEHGMALVFTGRRHFRH